jgi:signal transduction histidine kinase
VRWWSAAAQWRNWPLQVKLGMVLVVPVIGAGALGVLRVQSDIQLAQQYAGIQHIVDLRAQLLTTLTAIQNERNEAVRQSRGLGKLARVTDAEIAETSAAVARTPELGQDATQRYRFVTDSLTALPEARKEVAGGDGDLVLDGYNSVTSAVLGFDRALVGRFPDEELTNISIGLNELVAAREQVGIQQAAGLVAVRAGVLSESERSLLVESDTRLEDNLSDFRAVAPEDIRLRYETSVTGPEINKREPMVRAARAPTTVKPLFTAREWDASFNTTSGLMLDVTRIAADRLRDESAALADKYSNRAIIASLLLLLMVVLAAGVSGVLGRHLVRSVRLLRDTALDVADKRLPAAVASIRAGEGAKVAIDPVPVRTTEEFGQLARAFDAVHAQAVRSAAEEAGLRSNLAHIFTNLSRRSQGLVERQLRLMEQLEQKENDPNQLSNLFKIDHLATRMRRNNENLMVLSGSGLSRRFTDPMPLSDVLRAAVSEVEHYERALVRSAPDVRILGYAVGDLIRSVSELIENATKFSPPDSEVVITSRRAEDGALVIDILDDGIGMGEDELREANHRVAAGGGVDVPVSRQMGLFVIGRLTVRHGIQVRLTRRDDRGEGLRATLLVPASVLVTDASEGTGTASTPAQPAKTVVLPVPVDRVPLPAPTEPVEVSAVAGRLETFGIHVELPDLPVATTPASILFVSILPAEPLPVPRAGGGDGAFTWLHRGDVAPPAKTPAETPAKTPAETPGETPGHAGPTPPVEHGTGPNGLPKRVPKGQLLAPSMTEQRPAGRPTRNADRTRGFLSGFQAGVRDSEKRKGAGDE